MHSLLSKSLGKVFLPLAAIGIAASALIGIGGSHSADATTGDGTYLVELSYQSVQFPLTYDNGHVGGTVEAYGYLRAWAKNPTTGATTADGVREIAAAPEPAVCDLVPAAWGWSSTVMPQCKKHVDMGPLYSFADVMACREAVNGGCGNNPYAKNNNKFLLHVRPGDTITAYLNLFDDDGPEVDDDLCLPSKTVGGFTASALNTLDQTYTMAQGFNGTASCVVTFRVRTVDVPFTESQPPAPSHR